MPYKDRDTQLQAMRDNYEVTKEKRAAREKQRRDERYAKVRELMTPCVHCGEADPAVMDWHHVDPSTKDKGIAYLIRRASMERVLAEIEKCICLCANCHRRLHAYGPPETA